MSDMAIRTATPAWTELGPWPKIQDARVYVCIPPMLTTAGVSEFVIVARDPNGVIEIFAATEDGLLEEWEPLAVFAGADHDRALRACGFEAVTVDVA